MKKVKKGDTLLVCGDFGFVWNGGVPEEAALKKLQKLPYTVAFIDGQYENFERLNAFPAEDWNGAPARKVADNIIYLQRGEIYRIEDERYFAFGGGESPDAGVREEMQLDAAALPTAEEMQAGAANLKAQGADYILTYEPSGRARSFMSNRLAKLTGMNVYFSTLEDTAPYKRWFFGCLHQDKHVSGKHEALFQRVIPVREPGKTKH